MSHSFFRCLIIIFVQKYNQIKNYRKCTSFLQCLC